MIDIHSGNIDETSDEVLAYIKYLSQSDYQAIYGDRSVHCVSIIISNSIDKVDIIDEAGNKTNIRFKSGWLRRGIVSLKQFINFDVINKTINNHLTREIDTIKEFIYAYSLNSGSYNKEKYNNRITNLLLAKKSGLNIPATLITNSKDELKDFVLRYKSVVAKPIHNGHLFYIENGFSYNCKGTQILDKKRISTLDSEFPASLFQQYIKKEIEIRVFFWEKEYYSMAIFSQLDEQTKFDYRNYNYKKPNRCVPFKLEPNLLNKITNLMENIGLNTGSIDLILTPSGEYYFLEVNPTGQFGWLSKGCNFYLEKKIALELINKSNN